MLYSFNYNEIYVSFYFGGKYIYYYFIYNDVLILIFIEISFWLNIKILVLSVFCDMVAYNAEMSDKCKFVTRNTDWKVVWKYWTYPLKNIVLIKTVC